MKNDDIVKSYKATGSIRATARENGISPQTARRVLITEGIELIDQPKAERIRRLLIDHSPEEVASMCGVSEKTIKGYQEYTKGSYCVGEKTDNAIRIAKSRSKAR